MADMRAHPAVEISREISFVSTIVEVIHLVNTIIAFRQMPHLDDV